jgi:hypothetical protein
LEHRSRALSKCITHAGFTQQREPAVSEFLGLAYQHGVFRSEITDNVAKIFRVRTNHDCLAELSRLQDVVSSSRNQAATNKGNVGQRIHGRKFTDRVQQQHGASPHLSSFDRELRTSRKPHS